MAIFRDRTGDFTKKKSLYKFYKNGYTSRNPKYMTEGQYMGSVGTLISGTTAGNASVGGNVFDDSMGVFGSGDPNDGLSVTYKIATDPRRRFDIDGFMASFTHSYGATGAASVSTYEVQLFDYILRWTASGNTLRVFYKTTQLVSVTMSTAYSYIRMRELGGVFYIDRSSDGVTWVNWTSRTINRATDTLRTDMSLMASLGAGGNGMASAAVSSIEAVDQHNNLLAVESQALSDLEFNESINNPASSTTLLLPYSPLSVPSHCDIGNFVEVYTSFYDDGVIQNEPILDHNSSPILDESGSEIYGIVLHGNLPEKSSKLKFSGYISSIDYDYDNGTIALAIVSHGETMSNSIVRGGQISVPVITQQAQNATVATASSRQTFTLDKMTKVDTVSAFIQYGGGGSTDFSIGPVGGSAIASTKTAIWSGPIDSVITLALISSLYLQAGQYWVQASGGVNWKYQNTDVLEGGSRQALSGGVWSNVAGDAYVVIESYQLELALSLNGTSTEITSEIFSKSLMLDYSPLYIDEVEDAGYSINVALNVDSAKNAVDALYRQLPTGWFYHVDVGTNAIRIRDKNQTPDHLLVFGRDFTEMKVTKDIDEIINEVYFVGGALFENGPKLTTLTTDIDSVAEYRQGLAVISNDKVTRYDTAELLSNHTIGNNNAPRLTTEITLSAAKYDTESVRAGDVVKIVNGDKDVLGATLVVAAIAHSPKSITVSLDSAPRNLSKSIDAIQRNLENANTANAGAVL